MIVSSLRDKEKFNDFVREHPYFVQKLIVSSRGEGVKLIHITSDAER